MEQSISNEGRLGKCEVCSFNEAKYTCPKCEIKTCQIECLRIHKKELNCDGIRDKTKYIPLKKITEVDLMNDYVFLESCTNYASARRTDKAKRFTARERSLSIPQMKLKKAATNPERQIKLNFLLPNFDKHKANTTYYDWSSKVIYWCIEWRFINADNKIIFDERCNESKIMTELIKKYLDYSSSISALSCYRSKGLNNITLLLKAEGIRKSHNRFFPMDLSKSLQENLRRKTIVEFPVIYVIFDSDIQAYDVINADAENVIKETETHKNHYFPTNNRENPKRQRKHPHDQDVIPNTTEKNEKKPVNFFFSNDVDSMDDDSSEDC